jgi:hypothetical protein
MMRRLSAPALVVAIAAALIAIGAIDHAVHTSSARAADDRPAAAYPVGADAQDRADDGDDDRLAVQVWTVFAAVGAAAVGLLLFLVRIVTGGVQAPPP